MLEQAPAVPEQPCQGKLSNHERPTIQLDTQILYPCFWLSTGQLRGHWRNEAARYLHDTISFSGMQDINYDLLATKVFDLSRVVSHTVVLRKDASHIRGRWVGYKG